MSAPLSTIRNRINLTKNIEKITNALKLTSSTKTKKLLKGFANYKTFLEAVYSSLDLLNTAYEVPDNTKTIIYVVASEIGLCGAYNSRVYQQLLKEIKPLRNFEIILLGKKLEKRLAQFQPRKLVFPKYNLNSIELLNIIANEVNWITALWKQKALTKVIVIGHEYINQLIQKVRTFVIFPFEINPHTYPSHLLESCEFIPSRKDILASILPFYLSVALRAAIFESLLSIEAMRNIAMDNATKNAREFIDQLTLEYNRVRQAQITQEIIEIVSGADGGQ